MIAFFKKLFLYIAFFLILLTAEISHTIANSNFMGAAFAQSYQSPVSVRNLQSNLSGSFSISPASVINHLAQQGQPSSVKSATHGFFGSIAANIGHVVTGIAHTIKQTVSGFTHIIGSAVHTISQTITGIPHVIRNAVHGISQSLVGVGQAILSPVNFVPKIIVNHVANVIRGIGFGIGLVGDILILGNTDISKIDISPVNPILPGLLHEIGYYVGVNLFEAGISLVDFANKISPPQVGSSSTVDSGHTVKPQTSFLSTGTSKSNSAEIDLLGQ